MPDEKKDLPAPDPKESGDAKGKAAKDDQILAMLSQILAALQGGAGAGAAPPGGAEPQLSDEEYEKLLSQLEPDGESMPDEKGKEGEKPVKEGTNCGDSTGMDTKPTGDANGEGAKKMQRLESENAEYRTRLNRLEIERAIDKIALTHDVEVSETDIADLAAMPNDMRTRQLDRLKKLSRPKVGGPSGPNTLDLALADARQTRGTGKRLSDLPAQEALSKQRELIKLARDTGKRYEDVVREAGFTIPGESN
jgi:hypothetical protein